MMKIKQIIKTKQYEMVLSYVKVAGNCLIVAGNYALVAGLILMMIWLMGRVMDALHNNTVFDPVLTYWLVISIFSMLYIKIAGFGIASVQNIMQADRRWPVITSWAFFIAMVTVILFNYKGFQVSASGIFAAISGSAEETRQASFLMLKYHPANPMLAVNLLISKLKGVADIESLVPYAWNLSYIFAFFIWSFVYSILLLKHQGKTGSKTIYLFFSTASMVVLIFLKAMSTITDGQLILLHAIAVTLFIFQVLLTYSVIRAFAGPHEDTAGETPSYRMPDEEKDVEEDKHSSALPPSAFTFALCLFIILPVLADLSHQNNLASSSAGIMANIAHPSTQGDTTTRITITRISIYAGPAIGDEIVGFLPRGTRVPVMYQKYGWVNIGKNQWVSEKFLRPDDPPPPVSVPAPVTVPASVAVPPPVTAPAPEL